MAEVIQKGEVTHRFEIFWVWEILGVSVSPVRRQHQHVSRWDNIILKAENTKYSSFLANRKPVKGQISISLSHIYFFLAFFSLLYIRFIVHAVYVLHTIVFVLHKYKRITEKNTLYTE